MTTIKPPFRAEHIGSLLRPLELLLARQQVARGEIDRSALTAIEDAAVREALALQERVGLKLATDGEYRRRSYHSYFYGRLGDIRIDTVEGQDAQGGDAASGHRGAQPVAVVNSRIAWRAPINAPDAAFIKANTTLTPKVTLPGPCALHFRGGDAAVLASAYTDIERFWDDTINAFARELAAIAEAGCDYVQIDETAFAKFGDPQVQAMLAARGDDWSRLIDTYIDVTNRVLRKAPRGMVIGMHVCRGNRGGQWHAEGSYEDVAERMFNALDIPVYFLEYDTPRSGSFEPLRHVPASKHIVLGLVSTKNGIVEPLDDLAARVEGATRHVALDRLSVSPQCGFASVETGNPLTPAAQEAKLRLVVDLARRLWGEA